MEPRFLLEGLLIGFSIAAPVGPIGVLCIRRTLADGRTSGLATGLGAATADAVYGSVAAFGLTIISDFLTREATILRVVGGAFLLYLGARTFLARPAELAATATAAAAARGLAAAYGSTFFLTLTNPMTIISFTAVFAGLGLAQGNRSYLDAALLVGGVFVGSAAWWLVLSGGVGIVRTKVTSHGLRWVNRASGLVIAGFGIAAFLSG